LNYVPVEVANSFFPTFIFQGALDLVKGLMGRKANINRSTLDHITWCLVALISFVSNAHITDGRR